MNEKVRLRRRRAELWKTIDPPIPMVVSAFGVKMGLVVVGNAIAKTKDVVRVALKDVDGEWTEDYSLRTGTRIGDEDENDGWRITPADLVPIDPVKAGRLTSTGSGMKCLYRERVPITDSQEAVYEVWGGEDGSLYLKGCTEDTDDKGRIKQRTRLIPFAFLKKALADFCIDWG